MYAAAECSPEDFKPFAICDEELVLVDQEIDDPEYAFLAEEHQEYIENWLADTSNMMKLKGLGKGYEQGGKFVPICGDGNCFWNAISTNTTACKNMPLGTASKHNELRQKTCDIIIAHKDKKDSIIYKRMMDRKIPLEGKALDEYIAKKRQTSG